MIMNRRDELLEKAVRRFEEGFNCAQSVLLTMFEHWDGKNELIPKIATGFGGGIGRVGSVCGAITGAVMAIGVRYGTNEPKVSQRVKSYELARELFKRFEAQNSSVLCRELTGFDLSKPEELEKARAEKIFEKRCNGLVRSAIEILLELSEH